MFDSTRVQESLLISGRMCRLKKQTRFSLIEGRPMISFCPPSVKWALS